jgi:hypothetical protein
MVLLATASKESVTVTIESCIQTHAQPLYKQIMQ